MSIKSEHHYLLKYNLLKCYTRLHLIKWPLCVNEPTHIICIIRRYRQEKLFTFNTCRLSAASVKIQKKAKIKHKNIFRLQSHHSYVKQKMLWFKNVAETWRDFSLRTSCMNMLVLHWPGHYGACILQSPASQWLVSVAVFRACMQMWWCDCVMTTFVSQWLRIGCVSTHCICH